MNKLVRDIEYLHDIIMSDGNCTSLLCTFCPLDDCSIYNDETIYLAKKLLR